MAKCHIPDYLTCSCLYFEESIFNLKKQAIEIIIDSLINLTEDTINQYEENQ